MISLTPGIYKEMIKVNLKFRNRLTDLGEKNMIAEGREC